LIDNVTWHALADPHRLIHQKPLPKIAPVHEPVHGGTRCQYKPNPKLYPCSGNNPKESKVNVKHLNQRELAERWGISTDSLERWRCEGIGPVFLKLQGRVMYRLEDIEAYETESLRSSTANRAVIGGAA
jgi:hypothetical protein